MPTASAAITALKRRLVKELAGRGFVKSDQGYHRPSGTTGISEFVSIKAMRFSDKGSAGAWLIGGLAAMPAVHADMPLLNRQEVAAVSLPQALRTSRTDDAWRLDGEQEPHQMEAMTEVVLADLRAGLLEPLALVGRGPVLAEQIDHDTLPPPLAPVRAAQSLRARATLAALAGLPDAPLHIDRYAASVEGTQHLIAMAEYLRQKAR